MSLFSRHQAHILGLSSFASTLIHSPSCSRTTTLCLRRTLATALPPDHPAYKDAEEASKPKAVKDRQKVKQHHSKKGLDFPPLLANPTIGAQTPVSGERRKYRLRGVTRSGEVVGQRIYLPNIIMKMVKNGTKEGEPYNPFKATFHVPPSLTKNDIKSYLLSVYGVETTYINTEIPHVPGPRAGEGPKNYRDRRKPKFKRAIVGLVEPFYFPEDEPDMSEGERREWNDQMTQFGRGVVKDMVRMPVLKRVEVMRSGRAPDVGEREDKEVLSALEKERRMEKAKERLEGIDEGVIDQVVRGGK